MKLALIRRQFAAVGGAELYLQRLLAGQVEVGDVVEIAVDAQALEAGEDLRDADGEFGSGGRRRRAGVRGASRRLPPKICAARARVRATAVPRCWRPRCVLVNRRSAYCSPVSGSPIQ